MRQHARDTRAAGWRSRVRQAPRNGVRGCSSQPGVKARGHADIGKVWQCICTCLPDLQVEQALLTQPPFRMELCL